MPDGYPGVRPDLPGTSGPGYAVPLRFPDLLVRIRAALALGAALPKSQFSGSQLVMPVLARSLTQTGRQELMVVDPDGTCREVKVTTSIEDDRFIGISTGLKPHERVVADRSVPVQNGQRLAAESMSRWF